MKLTAFLPALLVGARGDFTILEPFGGVCNATLSECWLWDTDDCYCQVHTPSAEQPCYESRGQCCSNLSFKKKFQCNIRMYNDRGWDIKPLQEEAALFYLQPGMPELALKQLLQLDWNAYSAPGRYPF